MWITNAGKYAEGELACEPLKLPAATEELQSVLKRIGVDGVRYEEVFISHAQSDISGLCACLTEYENIDALNHLACLLSELDEGERETYKAVLEGGHAENVNDLINLTYNLDCWAFYPDIGDEESLGRLYLQEFGAVQVPEELLEEGFDVQKLLSQLEADPDMAYVLGDTEFSQFVEEARAAVQQYLEGK